MEPAAGGKSSGGPFISSISANERQAERLQRLIQGFIGPEHPVMDMPSFYGALVQALQ